MGQYTLSNIADITHTSKGISTQVKWASIELHTTLIHGETRITLKVCYGADRIRCLCFHSNAVFERR